MVCIRCGFKGTSWPGGVAKHTSGGVEDGGQPSMRCDPVQAHWGARCHLAKDSPRVPSQ